MLTYTTGRREHFYSPLYDRGEIEDVFSIHTDGEDIWEKMPQAELEKLERIWAGEAEAFPIEERIEAAGSIPDLKEIDYAATFKKIDATLSNVKMLTEKLNSKDNTVGLLLNDPQLYNNLNQTTINAANLLEDLKEHPKRYVHFSLFGKKDK